MAGRLPRALLRVRQRAAHVPRRLESGLDGGFGVPGAEVDALGEGPRAIDKDDDEEGADEGA